jgi:hypothetical protein
VKGFRDATNDRYRDFEVANLNNMEVEVDVNENDCKK